MIITNVEAENLKGRSFAYKLSERVAIVGPNFTGKTAIVEAIRLALMGYIPEIGKRTSATWELSSGQAMKVHLDFSDESAATRSWQQTGATVKETLLLGRALSDGFDNLPLLNADAYFGMTDTERTNYVFARIKLPDSYTPESIIAEVHRISFEEGHTEAHEKAKAELVAELRECFTGERSLKSLSERGATPTIQEALGAAVLKFKASFSYWNSRAKETIGAVRVLTELKNRESEFSATTMAELEREVKEAQGKLDALNIAKGNAQTAKNEAERNQAHIRELKKRLEADRIDYPRKLQKVRDKIAELTLQLKPVRSKEELDKLNTEYDTALKEQGSLLLDQRAQRNRFAAAKTAIEGLSGLGACPYCKSDEPGWKEKYLRQLTEEVDQATLAHDAHNQRLAELKESLSDLHFLIQGERDDRETNYNVNAGIGAAQHELELMERDSQREEDLRQTWKAELVEREGRAADVAPLEEIQQQRDEQQFKLDGKREQLFKAMRLQQDLKRAAESQLEYLDAKAHLDMVKAIGQLITEKRQAMIAETFTTLIAMANEICGSILKSPLDFHDGTVGRWTEQTAGQWTAKKFIPHRVFSGVEKALAYVSIAAALSAQSPLRILLLDELARLTPKLQARVMASLDLAIKSKLIDQAIVLIPADAAAISYPNLGSPLWQIVQTHDA